MNSDSLNPNLNQRGRAEVNFMINIFKGSIEVRKHADEDVQIAAGDVDALPDDMDARTVVIEPRLHKSRANRVRSLIGEWHARNHADVCERAFEDIFPKIKSDLKDLENGPAAVSYTHLTLPTKA